MHTNIGYYRVELSDDGTLDTVLHVSLRVRPEIDQDIRFSHERVADMRDPKTGELPVAAFEELAKEAADQFDEIRAGC